LTKVPYILLLTTILICAAESHAQNFKLRGTVFDSSGTYPLVSVSVLTTAGRGTATDIFGRYEIDVKETDSVWFSYLNKPTIKYAVAKIFDAERFDIALHINIPVLKEVIVKPRNYKLDSLRNRQDYAKVFNWEKPRLQATTGSGPGASVGFDLDEIIRMFQFRKNKSMLSFRERLLQEERDKFIDHRFSKVLVMRLTGLVGAERDSFMLRFRPSYEFCIETGEYDFQAWIKKCFEKWKPEKTAAEIKKEKL
jgi:hypothetical protein